jgi:hypothetical protein
VISTLFLLKAPCFNNKETISLEKTKNIPLTGTRINSKKFAVEINVLFKSSYFFVAYCSLNLIPQTAEN